MRMVIWTDKSGYRHRSVIKDNENDGMAPEGTLQDPPSIHDMDWDEIKRDLHNALVNRELFTYADAVSQQNGITGAIMDALRRKMMRLYKERRVGGR